MIIIFITFQRDLKNTIFEGPNVISSGFKQNIFCRNYSLNTIKQDHVAILGVIFLWLRIVNFFRYNEYLGKFVGVVKNLISEIFLFFVLYLINLLVFALFAEISFADIPDYNSFGNSFKTIFFASFGTFDF